MRTLLMSGTVMYGIVASTYFLFGLVFLSVPFSSPKGARDRSPYFRYWIGVALFLIAIAGYTLYRDIIGTKAKYSSYIDLKPSPFPEINSALLAIAVFAFAFSIYRLMRRRSRS